MPRQVLTRIELNTCDDEQQQRQIKHQQYTRSLYDKF